MDEPPKEMIDVARLAAIQSPCAKSKRGVVAYRDWGDRGPEWKRFHQLSAAFNGPPGSIECLGSDDCRRDCAKRCVHAEVRALRGILDRDKFHASDVHIVLLHVKVVEGDVVAGGGPGCWQCSREILDAGFIHGIWLFQTGLSVTSRHGQPDRWRYWEALDFHRETCAALGIP